MMESSTKYCPLCKQNVEVILTQTQWEEGVQFDLIQSICSQCDTVLIQYIQYKEMT